MPEFRCEKCRKSSRLGKLVDGACPSCGNQILEDRKPTPVRTRRVRTEGGESDGAGSN